MTRRDQSLVPLPSPILRPIAWAYGLAVSARNRRFDRGHGVRRLDCPVVSVGNLSVGGTGKTPVVAWVVERLAAAGRRPVIALRGYRPDASGRSDEAMLHRDAMPEVPIAVGADRFRAVRELGEPRDERCVVVLDDGFQHRRLHRDFDLVLIDATRAELNGHLLPHGRLREAPEALRRADAVLVTHASDEDEGLAEAIERRHGRPPVAWCRHRWDRLTIRSRDRLEHVSPEWLADRRVATLLGVGNPGAIRRRLAELGGREGLSIPVRDHERYDDATIAGIGDRCRRARIDTVLTTSKDWVKLRGRWPANLAVVVPELSVEFTVGENRLVECLLQAVPLS